MKGFLSLLGALWVLGAPVLSADKLVTVLPARPGPRDTFTTPLVHWQEVKKEPRPLHISCLMADLNSRETEATAFIAPAPGVPKQAEAVLEEPEVLTARPGVIAAVNSNWFQALTASGSKKSGLTYDRGTPVHICGWAKDATHEASPKQTGFESFWTDPNGYGHIGNLGAPREARMAVAGQGLLVRAGVCVAAAKEPIHPRTAVGLDSTGKVLWLVVVDGRKAGYSEGMSLAELAALMKELGCWNALNLDGGGSSIMMLATHGEKLEVVNHPSGSSERMIPVMLGIQRRASRGTP